MLLFYLLLLIAVAIIHSFYIVISGILYKVKINNLLESINTREDLLYARFKDILHITVEVFKRKGYKVKITDKCGEDGNGLILNDIQYVEIWKHSLNQKVEVETTMKLAKCMRINSIYRGMYITLGDFKENTKMFCHKNVIECINGEQFLQMCKEVQRKKSALQVG